MNGHTLRQLVVASLTANALRPQQATYTAIPSFAAGWLTGELAPQLLALTALDTAVSAARHRVRPFGLALAAGSAVGLGSIVAQSLRADVVLDEALTDTAGSPEVRDRAPWSTLARPFWSLRTLAEVEVLRDVAYTEGGRKAKLDIYRPRGVDLTKAPVLVQIHGGAWTIGRKEEQGLLLLNRMSAAGWVGVSLNYRLAPKHRWPTQIIDVKRGLAWVHEHIGEHGGDTDHVVLTGGSAGGHLAALAALTPGRKVWQPGFEDADTRVAACVPFYGVYDMSGDDRYATGLRRFLRRRVFAPDATVEDFREASPVSHVGPDAPDFFVIHGANDTLVHVSQARAFVAALRTASRATVSYAELPGTQHAFDVFGSIRAQQAVRAVERWLQWQRATTSPPPEPGAR